MTPVPTKPQPTKPPLVIYHKGCRDGFCAAWVVWRFYPDAEFYAASYNNPAPDVPQLVDREVIIVDFSYPLDDMIRIADAARSLLVLDHHKTAQAALTSPEAKEAFAFYPNTKIVFDMNRSGAGLAWDEFFPPSTGEGAGGRPWIVDYVEDRDLWRFALPNSQAFNAFIGTIPYTFEAWTKVARTTSLEKARQQGEAVEAKVAQYVSEVSGLARIVTFEGYEVPCVNAPHVDISELLHHLAITPIPFTDGNGRHFVPKFSLGWSQHADGKFVYSLRSVGDFDVSEIAKKYGGGGHKNAAGFKADTLLSLKGHPWNALYTS
jgi:oligoribonuclease NrnB/cAMP/cGMP phosphodiesterase (DHH superfamily)